MAVSLAVDQSAKARVLGIQTAFKDLRGGTPANLPQRIMVVGQGSSASVYDTVKTQVTSAGAVAAKYGFGSPLHLAALQLFPVNGDGVGTIPVTIYPLNDDGAGVVSTGDITPGGAPTEAASYRVRVNNIDSEAFLISVGDSVADIVTAMTEAINATLEMPIIAADGATTVNITSKWKGASANDIFIEVTGSTTAGNTFAITQTVGGLTNPSVDDALAQVGEVWESMGLNCLDIDDTTALGAYSDFGEGRWGALTRKPLVFFTGNNAITVALATVVSDARKTDRTNGQLVAPGSKDLPFVTAARQLARIVKVANNNPPQDYGSQQATGLTPGLDGEQWTYADRDSAIKKGSSSTIVKDGVINIADVVTFYHPTGDPTPAYAYVVDVVRAQQVLYNLAIIFEVPEWDGAPLIPDGQPTTNPSAKTPSAAKTQIAALIDGFGLAALISDPKTAKTTIVTAISETNPKRLDGTFTLQFSGNSNIISLDFNFGFFFGTAPVV